MVYILVRNVRIVLMKSWASDRAAFNTFFHSMLDSGIYLGPSAFEAGFVSAAHTDADIAATVAAAEKAFAKVLSTKQA